MASTNTTFDLSGPAPSKLVRLATHAMLTGSFTFMADTVIAHRIAPQSRLRYARALVERGWAASINMDARKLVSITIRPRAILTGAEATVPDLQAKWEERRDIDKDIAPHGVSFRVLSLPEQVHVALQGGYQMAVKDRWDKLVPAVPGQIPYDAFSDWGRLALVVCTPALQTYIDDRRLAAAAQQVFTGNLPWALHTFAGVPEADAKSWLILNPARREDGWHFHSDGARGELPEDTTKWDEAASAAIVKAQEQVQAALTRLASLQTTVARVQATGGWERLAGKLQGAALEAAKARDAEQRLAGKSDN